MNDHRTCRDCGATLGTIDIDAVVDCPICGMTNEVASDKAVALTEIETAAELRVKLATVRSLAKTVADNERTSSERGGVTNVRCEWFAKQILEITEL